MDAQRLGRAGETGCGPEAFHQNRRINKLQTASPRHVLHIRVTKNLRVLCPANGTVQRGIAGRGQLASVDEGSAAISRIGKSGNANRVQPEPARVVEAYDDVLPGGINRY